MSDVWTPMIQHREPLPMCNILELLDGTRLESGTVREVRAFARGAGSCWVARFDGLDAALMPQRTFMKERGTSHREVDGIWLREDLFSCEEDGFYEARSWMRADGTHRAGYRSVYFSLTREHGFVMLDAEQFQEATIASCGVDFGDGRSLVASEESELALRAANWIPNREMRDAARDYVASARAQRERQLPALIGTEATLSAASEVRARARRALDAHLAGIASHTEEVPTEIFEQARGWLLEKTLASFWLEHREQLAHGSWIWERFLSEITE